MAIIIDAKALFIGKKMIRRCQIVTKEVCMPIEMKWACPNCGERAVSQGGCYEIFFAVRKCTAGESIVLRGVCPACGEENNPPAPYL
jgi:rRNA maturation protein Nop10